jgi:hypothetical protein
MARFAGFSATPFWEVYSYTSMFALSQPPIHGCASPDAAVSESYIAEERLVAAQ